MLPLVKKRNGAFSIMFDVFVLRTEVCRTWSEIELEYGDPESQVGRFQRCPFVLQIEHTLQLEDLELDVICGTLKVIPPAEWKQPSPKNCAKDVLGDVIVDKPLKPTFTTIYEGGGTFISEAKSRISVENGKKVPVDQPI